MSSPDRLPLARRREQALARLLARADRLLARAQLISTRFSRWRLAIFLTGALCTVIPYKLGWFHLGNAALGLFILIFLVVARYHNRLEGRMHRLRQWRAIKSANLGQLRLDWKQIPPRSSPSPEAHPYAVDLDITGPHSLLHLLDQTVSSSGRERLAGWLLDQTTPPPSRAEWRTRQALVKELAGLHLFRDRLVLEASLAGEAEVDGHRILAALQAPAGFPGLTPLLATETLLALSTVTLILSSALTGLPDYWIFSFSLYAALYMLFSGRVAPVFSRALSLHAELDKLNALFRFLESRSYSATPELERLCKPLVQGRTRPSGFVKRLGLVCHALSLRAHPLVHLAVNVLGPWDLAFIHRLETVRQQVAAELPAWLDRLAEIEAASSLGNFASQHPDYAWPSPSTTTEGRRSAGVAAKGLGHPLIPQARRVVNDLELSGLGRILIVTGSNMSGKSTFLRTIGINVCLAQAGAPVCAQSFAWTWTRLSCCIRIDDSLEAGLSFFYAEVKRLKRLLDAARDRTAPPLLFLIDELFKGTNNRERLAGSRAFIRALASSHAFGLVTTHDLELAELEKEIPTAGNAHFQETVEARELRFDYRLRPGPCPTTNALRIMALEGLPVPDSTNGEQ